MSLRSTIRGRRDVRGLIDLASLGAAAGIVALTALRFWRPEVELNETVYLLRGRTLVDPGFLAADWTLGLPVLTVAFDLLTALLWSVTENAVRVALVARLIAWSAVSLAFVAFARAAKIRPAAAVLAFAAFVLSGQGLMAGEWIVRSAESKSFAYAFLLAALALALRRRPLAAGLATGLACVWHLLVGGWGALCLGVALFVAPPRRGQRRRAAARYIAGAALAGLPAAWMAMRYAVLDRPGGGDPPLRPLLQSLVEMRNPHHLDPAQFAPGLIDRLTPLLLWVIILLLLQRPVPPRAARLISTFSGTAAALFILGFVARSFDGFGFLVLYPFRLADAFLPLLFWLAAAGFLLRRRRSGRRRFRSAGERIALVAVIAGLLLVVEFRPDSGERLLRGVQRVVAGKWHQARYVRTPAPPMEQWIRKHWIRKHTPSDAVVLVTPCAARFRITAERAMVVLYKSAPSNRGLAEWHRRIEDVSSISLLGGPPTPCGRLSRGLDRLPRTRLTDLRNRYGADYYVTRRPRPDLAGAELHRDDHQFLYDLTRLTPAAQPGDPAPPA
jgi:hypothetical protein